MTHKAKVLRNVNKRPNLGEMAARNFGFLGVWQEEEVLIGGGGEGECGHMSFCPLWFYAVSMSETTYVLLLVVYVHISLPVNGFQSVSMQKMLVLKDFSAKRN